MTIGDLECRAGIEQTEAARAAFWKPYAHLDARAMLDSGVAELRARIAADDTAGTFDKEGLSAEEQAAIQDFAARHGRYWKAELNRQLINASATPILHALRNRLGPSWLAKYRQQR